MCLAFRKKTRENISRADLIRMLIDGFLESGIDVTAAEDKDELREMIAEAFSR